MKVLNFEDSVYKANAIRKILGNRCGVASVEQVSNIEDGLKMLKDVERCRKRRRAVQSDHNRYAFSNEVRSYQRYRSGRKVSSDSAGAGKSNQDYRMFLKKYETSRCVWMHLVFGNQ